MKSLFRLVFFALLLGGWGLAALSLYVVRTPTAIGLIPKNRLGIQDTYLDTRTWTLDDVAKHPQVVSRILDTGQADLLRHVTGKNGPTDGSALEHQLAEAIKHSRNHMASTTSSSAIDLDRSEALVKSWWAMR